MPELPEVETVVRTLRVAVEGARIVGVRHASRRVALGNPRHWREAIRGRTISAITRRGKYIIMSLNPRGALVVHLRMTGRFRLYPASAKRGIHDRLIFEVADGPLPCPMLLTLIDTRQFARGDFLDDGAVRKHSGIAKLGAEADTISETELRRVLAKSSRPIKSLLLDQTALAGLGNIYADESLFLSGIHPLTPSNLIDRGQVRRLRSAMRRILQEAIDSCGTTIDSFSDLSGEAGGFAPRLKVYGRTEELCQVCRTPITRIVLAGRSAHFCPNCQTPPS